MSSSLRIAAIPAAAIALMAAGCGSSKPPGSGTGRTPGVGADAFKFARCMRAHGLRDFPDPKVSVSSSGGSQRVAVMIGGGVNKDSPRFRAAAQACRGILPAPGNNSAQDAANQRARALYLLAFARCLRAHGVTGFPDPTAQGELRLQMVQAAGVDIHTPAFLAAGKACAGVTHGAITAAEVERAVNGSGR